jgi:redox-sensitive bicupin YhaK (pirin superfamily)
MISVRKSEDRHHLRRGLARLAMTFDPSLAHERYRQRFHALVGLDEDRLPPGASVHRRATRAAEVVTYVLEGAVSHDDPPRAQLVAGEFQCWHVQRNGHYHANASSTERAHCFQISLRRQANAEAIVQQRRFPVGDRRDALRIVASPDGRDGSLRIAADALIYSATLQLGQHVAHELSPTRGVWLHVVDGEIRLGTLVLKTGDGSGVTNERVLSLTASAPTELLLIDLATRGTANDPKERLKARVLRKRNSSAGRLTEA